jgi:hypothetical protein
MIITWAATMARRRKGYDISLREVATRKGWAWSSYMRHVNEGIDRIVDCLEATSMGARAVQQLREVPA